MSISVDLLKILACPKCKGELIHREEKPALECTRCLLSFPVRDDIPVMLIEEAESMKKDR
jgi:uncharacterized protein YbaR (Trm112 family)